MRIVLIDNHVLFREGLASLLQNQPDIEVIAEARSIKEAYPLIYELLPDLILADLGARPDEGLEIIREICLSKPAIAVVILSNEESDDLVMRSLRCGAKGFIVKNSSLDIVLASIRALPQGEVALSRKMTRRVIDEIFRRENNGQSFRSGLDSLTTREKEVLRLLAAGATNRQIAGELFISENTAKIHVHNILEKLKLRNRHEAARLGHLISLDQP